MAAPLKPWEGNPLLNSTQIRKSAGGDIGTTISNTRSAPVVPPFPRSSPLATTSTFNSYMPYSGGYNSFGYGNYSSYPPYRSSMYSPYGSFGNYGGYGGMYGGMGSYPGYGGGPSDDAERRFIQYAEEHSRHTFASVESIVRTVNSISMMLDNTFFAMTSSFRAVLGVAENFGRLRSMFGQIWYSLSIFRLLNWLYRKLMSLLGVKMPKSEVSMAWRQASGGSTPGQPSSWPTFAFLGVLISAPYIISKFLPKYEDKCNPANWKSPGIRAKAAFDYLARNATELTVQINDDLILAPTYVQEEMNLKNSGWAYAVSNGRSGCVPLQMVVISKTPTTDGAPISEMPVPRVFDSKTTNNTAAGTNTNKTNTKRVSFGENQIFENVDLEDYMTGKKELKPDTKEKAEENKEEIKTV